MVVRLEHPFAVRMSGVFSLHAGALKSRQEDEQVTRPHQATRIEVCTAEDIVSSATKVRGIDTGVIRHIEMRRGRHIDGPRKTALSKKRWPDFQKARKSGLSTR